MYLTAYQTAESLAAVAQQVFDKNLKPIAPTNATNSNSNIANYLDQLKNAVNNKSSFIKVMKLVHVKLHPTLISAYNLGLRLESRKINHILGRVHHPQTNGKIERFYETFQSKIQHFYSMEEFVIWYNTKIYGIIQRDRICH